SINFGGMYTLKNQTSIFLEGLKKTDDNNYTFQIGGNKWKSEYFGINNARGKSGIDYEFDGYEMYLGKANHINNKNLYGYKLGYETYNMNLDEKTDDKIYGLEGIPLVSIGVNYIYDTRDNDMNSKKGIFFEYQINNYFEKLSTHKFIENEFEIKYFKSVTSKTVLGIHSILKLKCGEIPFQKYSQLGDDSLMRGFAGSKYIDENKFAVQMEYRYPIYKRLSGIIFSSVGEVFSGNNFKSEKLKDSHGLGIRYNLSKEDNINLRLDVAFNSDDGNIYLNIGESF
ncbi:MAG: BamA/TamA family outer membrane protein, partial [Fusobacteriota bacterium]